MGRPFSQSMPVAEHKIISTQPPDGGYGWIVVFAAFMQHVHAFGLAYALGVYYPSLREDFMSDSSTTAWVSGSHLAMLFCSGPVAGWMISKLGTRPVSFIGSIVAGLGCIGAAYAKSIVVVIVFLGIASGTGTGFMFISAITAVTQWFSAKRSLATGIAVCGAGLGVFANAPLIRSLLSDYDRQGALLIEGALAFQGCIFALLLRAVPVMPTMNCKPANIKPNCKSEGLALMQQNTETRCLPAHDDGEILALKERLTTTAEQTREHAIADDSETGKPGLQNWIFWIFAANQFLTFLSASGPLVFLYNRAVQDLKIEKMHASYVISIMGISNTIGRLAFGTLGNIFPRSRLFLLGGSVMVYGLATFASTFGDSLVSICIHAAMFGAGYGCMFALTTVVLADFFGVAFFGYIYGNIGVFRGLACLIGPPFGGWLIAQTDGSINHAYLFMLMGLLGFSGGLLLLSIPLIEKIKFKTIKTPNNV